MNSRSRELIFCRFIRLETLKRRWIFLDKFYFLFCMGIHSMKRQLFPYRQTNKENLSRKNLWRENCWSVTGFTSFHACTVHNNNIGLIKNHGFLFTLTSLLGFIFIYQVSRFTSGNKQYFLSDKFFLEKFYLFVCMGTFSISANK